MPSDLLEQKAKELLDGIESGRIVRPRTLAHLLLALADAVDTAAEKRTAERCAEIAQRIPRPVGRGSSEVAEAIRAEFLGGKG